jgi:hypothetical protein
MRQRNTAALPRFFCSLFVVAVLLYLIGCAPGNQQGKYAAKSPPADPYNIERDGHYIPSGWMGNAEQGLRFLRFRPCPADEPHGCGRLQPADIDMAEVQSGPGR